MLIKKAVALLTAVGLSTVVFAQGNTFDKVRYNGGSISTKVKPDDWNNKLTVTSEQISLGLNDGQTVSITPKQVTSLSYGHR